MHFAVTVRDNSLFILPLVKLRSVRSQKYLHVRKCWENHSASVVLRDSESDEGNLFGLLYCSNNTLKLFNLRSGQFIQVSSTETTSATERIRCPIEIGVCPTDESLWEISSQNQSSHILLKNKLTSYAMHVRKSEQANMSAVVEFDKLNDTGNLWEIIPCDTHLDFAESFELKCDRADSINGAVITIYRNASPWKRVKTMDNSHSGFLSCSTANLTLDNETSTIEIHYDALTGTLKHLNLEPEKMSE